MTPRSTRLVALLAIASLSSLASAAEPWTVTDSSFATKPINLIKLDASGVTGTAGDEKIELPLSTLVQLTRVAKVEAPKGLVLCLAGGDRLVGTPKKLSGTSLTWSAAGVGDVTVSIDQALGILRDKTMADNLAADRTEDEARLANGDSVRGIVTAASETTITITPTGADPVELPLTTITQLLLASPPGGRKPLPSPAFTVRFTNGGAIGCSSVALSGDQFDIKPVAGSAAKVAATTISVIEQTGGPIAWLSSRQPSESVYTPWFEGQFTPQMDRTVTGDPIRFGNVTYARGIGVHSKTKMSWKIEPGDTRFRTRYAIDPAYGYADVDVRVYVDDKIVHEQKGFKAGKMSDVVEADLAGAKQLTLEVDYGSGYDIQDRLNWIEPAILRKQ